MLKFNDYFMILENYNQMKTLFMKEVGQDVHEVVAKGDSYEYLFLKILIGVDDHYTKLCTDPKIQATYGDNIKINEEKERSMRSYLGMFTKMLYDEYCPLEIIKDISTYILQNKTNLRLTVKNNVTGDTQVLSNLLDIFKFKEKVEESGDNRLAYEILTDAIRDTEKEKKLTSFINEMPSILKQQFKIDANRAKLNDIYNIYEDLEPKYKQAIYSTFFGDGNTTGKISRYKNADEFLKDFNTLINNRSNFDIDKIKDEIINTIGAKLLVCDYKNKYIIADIWNHDASNKLGEPSSWCISYNNNSSYWNNNYMDYHTDRKMFFIWNFNLEQSNPLSKIAANINSDGSLNLVCDKNDKCIDGKFKEYLKEYKIKTSFLKTPISEEERVFKHKEITIQTLKQNIFGTVDINDNNYKEEIINRLDLCKENNIDISSYTLSTAINSLISNIHSSSPLRNEIEIYNICLDELGVDEYKNDLFSYFITKPNISKRPIQENAIKPLYDLFIRLGKKINLTHLEQHLNEFEFLDNIPFIKNAIIKEIEEKLYSGNYNARYLSTYINIFGHEYLDNNFDIFFNDELSKNITNDVGITILAKIVGVQTKNNFLKKLNDIGISFNKLDHLTYDTISKTTGLNETVFTEDNYDYILDVLIVDSGVYYEESYDNYKAIIKEFLNNNRKYNHIIFSKYNSHYTPLAVKFFLTFDIDISDCPYGMLYEKDTYQKYYDNKSTIFLYDVLNNKVEFSKKEDFGDFTKLIFKENMYVGKENIDIINEILDITPTLDISIDLSLEDISVNIPLCEAIVKYEVLKDDTLFKSVLDNKVKKIREMYHYIFK